MMKNENICKMYERKKADLEKYTEFMLKTYGTEEKLEMARKIYEKRYDLVKSFYDPDKALDYIQMQAARVSNECLKLLFGDINLDRLLNYCAMKAHVRILKNFCINETAVFVRDSMTVGIDDYDCLGIATFTMSKNGIDIEYFVLTDEYYGEHFDYWMESELPEGKKEKVIAYWVQNGMLPSGYHLESK